MLGRNASKYFEQVYKKDPQLKKELSFFKLMFAIADSIQGLRKEKGLTQSQLARRLKTTQSTIASWETPGYDGYTVKKLYQIANELGYMVEIKFRPVPTITEEISVDWIKSVDQALFAREFGEKANVERLNTSNLKGEMIDDKTHLVSFM